MTQTTLLRVRCRSHFGVYRVWLLFGRRVCGGSSRHHTPARALARLPVFSIPKYGIRGFYSNAQLHRPGHSTAPNRKRGRDHSCHQEDRARNATNAIRIGSKECARPKASAVRGQHSLSRTFGANRRIRNVVNQSPFAMRFSFGSSRGQTRTLLRISPLA